MFPGWMGFQPMMMPVNQNPMQPQMQPQMQAMMGRGAMPSGMTSGMNMLPDLAASAMESGKTDEEKQRAVVVKALKEIADTEKTREKPKEDDSERSSSKKASGADSSEKKLKCFLHQKPNKNCKKCQAALSQAAALEAAEAEDKPRDSRDALDADEIMRRNNSKSSDGSSERKNLQCSPMLKEQIVKSAYFKSLLDIVSVDGLVHEITQYVDTLDVYNPGGKTTPSCFICHVFRLSVLPHIENELGLLIDNREYSVVRCVGFLYLRFVTPASELWDALEEYLLDDMELAYAQDGSDVTTTIGEYVESLLTQDKYFDSPLPRLPVKVRQMVEEKVAPILQHRKRMVANRHALTLDNVEDMPVEVCMDGTWLRGTAKELANHHPSRVKVKVRLEGGVDVKVHLGKVVIVDRDDSDQEDGGRRRRRSRSRSRDWSRWKGKSDADMLQELRERHRQNAVCGSGKAYTKRPLSFDNSMASTALPDHAGFGQAYEVSASSNSVRRRLSPEESEAQQEAFNRKRREEDERQRRLASVYKKYCATPTQSSGSAYQEVDKPDVLRFG